MAPFPGISASPSNTPQGKAKKHTHTKSMIAIPTLKKNKAGRLAQAEFKINYNAIAIKTV